MGTHDPSMAAAESDKRKFKPFQVHLVKINKKGKSGKADADGSQPAETQGKQVNKVLNVSETVRNVNHYDKKKLMDNLMTQLESIQSKANAL